MGTPLRWYLRVPHNDDPVGRKTPAAQTATEDACPIRKLLQQVNADKTDKSQVRFFYCMIDTCCITEHGYKRHAEKRKEQRSGNERDGVVSNQVIGQIVYQTPQSAQAP